MYHRVTGEERRSIHRWRQEGHGPSEIGRRLGRPTSCITREVQRNTGGNGYRYQQADEMARARATRCVPRRFTEEIRLDAERWLREEGWTPQIICERARLEGRAHVCKETLYQHIYADAKAGGRLWTFLPRARRKRRPRCPRLDRRGRGRLLNQRRIDVHPAEVDARQTVGHWEGDLINGAPRTGNLVTLVERNTRFTLVGRTQHKDAEEVTRAIMKLFLPLPASARQSLTLDNGKEFAGHEELARELGAGVFFAYPYHSWERGTNENTNGLIRRLHPKKSSFAGIGDEELRRIDRYVNDRPRKCLGWMTPREKMAAFLGCAS